MTNEELKQILNEQVEQKKSEDITTIQEYKKLINEIEIYSYAALEDLVSEQDRCFFKEKCTELENSNFNLSIEEAKEDFLNADFYPQSKNNLIQRFKYACIKSININYRLMKGTLKLSEIT